MDQNKIEYIKQLKESGISDSVIRKAIQDKFNVKKTRGNEIFRELFDAGVKTSPVPPQKTAKAVFKGDTGVAESVDLDVRTLERIYLKFVKSIWIFGKLKNIPLTSGRSQEAIKPLNFLGRWKSKW